MHFSFYCSLIRKAYYTDAPEIKFYLKKVFQCVAMQMRKKLLKQEKGNTLGGHFFLTLFIEMPFTVILENLTTTGHGQVMKLL